MISLKKASIQIGRGDLQRVMMTLGGSGLVRANYLMAGLYLEMTMDKNIVWEKVNDPISNPKEVKEQEPRPCHLRHHRHRD